MKYSDIFNYSLSFEKIAEYGPDHSDLSKIINKAKSIIQETLNYNREYFSREYFGGKNFSVEVIGGDESNSIIWIKTTPEIQPAKGVEKATNVQYFEMEMLDKLMPLGVTLKVKNR